MPEKNRHTLDLNILQVWFSHWSLWIQKCPHLPLNVAHVGLWSTRHWTTGIWACSGYVSRFLQKPAVWPASFGRACWENQQPTNSQYGWEHWPEFSGGSVRTQPLSSGDRWTNSRLLVKGAVRVFFLLVFFGFNEKKKACTGFKGLQIFLESLSNPIWVGSWALKSSYIKGFSFSINFCWRFG